MSKSKAKASGEARSQASDKAPKYAWLYIFAGIILITVAMMVLSFPVGLYTVFATPLSNNNTASTPVYALTYDLSFARVQIPISTTLGGVFIAFLAVYAVFLLLAARQGAGILRALSEAATSKGYLALFSNPLAATTVVLGAVSLLTVVVDTLQSDAGIQTGGLNGDPFSLLVAFTVAPLFEESTFRLIMLGLPIFILSLLIFRDFSPRNALRVLWRPSAAWDLDETEETGMSRSFDSDPSIFPSNRSTSPRVKAMRPIVYVFLVLSSISFGYAHYASGAGWGPGKVSEAAFAGLALGYLYVRYGFHTNVLLHWSIDYVGSVYSFLGQGAYGVPWTSGTGSLLGVVPTAEIVLLLGIPSALIVMNELLKGLTRRGGRT